MAKYSEAQRRANEKYNAKAYDEIKVRVHKGKKDTIKDHADKQSESVYSFINRAIDETMERDNKNNTSDQTENQNNV